MEVQESFWSARERTVIAKIESNLDKIDDVRVAFRELEHLVGPEDSEVGGAAACSKSSVQVEVTIWWQEEFAG